MEDIKQKAPNHMTIDKHHQDNLKLLEKCLSNIAKNLPNFVPRITQKQMMHAVFTTLMNGKSQDIPLPKTGKSVLIVEGPTGTGKSLAYLLPAVIAAKALDKYLVISSATVILQEQLARKDLPFIAKHAGIPITYTIAKGRSRYACIQKLYRYGTRMPQVDLFGNEDEEMNHQHPNAVETNQLSTLADLFDQKEWPGDKDSLPVKIPEKTWARITNDRHGCIKRSCPHYHECPFFQARARLQEVDIIIANHDLLLSDLSMGGGAILTPPDDTLYCIDEAHHLSDKAIKQFAASHTIFGALSWLEKLPTTIGKIETLLKEFRWRAKISSALETIVESLQNLSIVLGEFFPIHASSREKTHIFRAQQGKFPAEISHFDKNLIPALTNLLNTLNTLQSTIKRQQTNYEEKSKEPAFHRFAVDLGFYIARVENMLAVWMLFATEVNSQDPPIAKWIKAELSENGTQIEYTLSASHISAASLLSEKFFSISAGVVLTSATLRTLGTFEKLLVDTGLIQFPETQCLALPSPFPLKEQGVFLFPKMKSDPTHPEAHTKEIITLLPGLLDLPEGEGALVLFSSHKQMLETAKSLDDHLKEMLLIQSDGAKEKLLATHFERISKKQNSILFGLASFAEGLDLPGKACTKLIIAKLPFAVPDDPVSETRAEWITAQGGNPFIKMTLPETSIKLIQAVGRLIRSETDKGTVVILDNRLLTKSYGRLLRKDLPPFEVIIETDSSLVKA